MLFLSATAAMLLLTGGAIITVQVLRKPSPFAFLLQRGVDPHLWGFHFLGAGSLLSLVLLALGKTPWSRLELFGRIALAAALLWSLTALLLSGVALLGSAPKGGTPPVLPSQETKRHTWPGAYRLFLLFGFASLGAVAWVAF
jgi:hypothetical protein